ncbi:hypothetical protein M9H77_27682 [Catharanthus roseus]|uniref:Uncharacterized protein n=1 Tax=Catharanthus roseus TaxID=4058 RepID=A0ACC0AFC8_CATRO|nr:hypothetical protein M9H77_27682 [Catharanthus roseus]
MYSYALGSGKCFGQYQSGDGNETTVHDLNTRSTSSVFLEMFSIMRYLFPRKMHRSGAPYSVRGLHCTWLVPSTRASSDGVDDLDSGEWIHFKRGVDRERLARDGQEGQQTAEVLCQEFLIKSPRGAYVYCCSRVMFHCGAYKLVPRGTQMSYSTAVDLVAGLEASQFKQGDVGEGRDVEDKEEEGFEDRVTILVSFSRRTGRIVSQRRSTTGGKSLQIPERFGMVALFDYRMSLDMMTAAKPPAIALVDSLGLYIGDDDPNDLEA